MKTIAFCGGLATFLLASCATSAAPELNHASVQASYLQALKDRDAAGMRNLSTAGVQVLHGVRQSSEEELTLFLQENDCELPENAEFAIGDSIAKPGTSVYSTFFMCGNAPTVPLQVEVTLNEERVATVTYFILMLKA